VEIKDLIEKVLGILPSAFINSLGGVGIELALVRVLRERPRIREQFGRSRSLRRGKRESSKHSRSKNKSMNSH
jgi:hypothetical protein